MYDEGSLRSHADPKPWSIEACKFESKDRFSRFSGRVFAGDLAFAHLSTLDRGRGQGKGQEVKIQRGD